LVDQKNGWVYNSKGLGMEQLNRRHNEVVTDLRNPLLSYWMTRELEKELDFIHRNIHIQFNIECHERILRDIEENLQEPDLTLQDVDSLHEQLKRFKKELEMWKQLLADIENLYVCQCPLNACTY
jgi:uncharacterized coiled-coil DUF342 family protein